MKAQMENILALPEPFLRISMCSFPAGPKPFGKQEIKPSDLVGLFTPDINFGSLKEKVAFEYVRFPKQVKSEERHHGQWVKLPPVMAASHRVTASWLLHLQSSSPQRHLGKQQRKAPGLGPLSPMFLVSGSGLGHSLGLCSHVGSDQWVDDLCFSLLLFALPFSNK